MNNDHYPIDTDFEPHLLDAEIDKLLFECSKQYEFESESPSSSGILGRNQEAKLFEISEGIFHCSLFGNYGSTVARTAHVDFCTETLPVGSYIILHCAL